MGGPPRRGHDVIWPRCAGPSVPARGPRPRAHRLRRGCTSRDRGNAERCARLVPQPRRPRGVRAGAGPCGRGDRSSSGRAGLWVGVVAARWCLSREGGPGGRLRTRELTRLMTREEAGGQMDSRLAGAAGGGGDRPPPRCPLPLWLQESGRATGGREVGQRLGAQ